MAQLPVIQPSRVTVMIKPVGALCNLDCTYCYYLPTKTIYDHHEHRMSEATLESIFASILPRFADDVTIAWQGGEPTLAGLGFFEKAIAFQEKHRRPGQRVTHALQTNGTLLDDRWCRFFREHQFLIGLSVDGPARFHDHYRRTNRGQATAEAVIRGQRLLQQHAVDYNILCVLNDRNVHHPEEILRYLLNLGSRWLQFIPAIEWEPDPERPGRNALAAYSPAPADYGRFLCKVFDLWFERYRKRVSIRIIDAVLNKLVLGQMPLCILDGGCHNQLTIEHDGAVFGCDHFVERRWQLARIGEPGWVNHIDLEGREQVGLTIHGDGYRKNAELPGRDIDDPTDLETRYAPTGATAAAVAEAADEAWYDRVDQQRLGGFAVRKQDLPEKCRACQWKPFCHGGCPKHREHGGDVPEPTILCEAYMMFYEHAMPRLKWLAGYLQNNMQPPDPEPVAAPAAAESPRPSREPAMASHHAATEAPAPQAGAHPPPAANAPGAAGAAAGSRSFGRNARSGKIGRNEPCPCGSGLKYKHCHGQGR